jgi:flagellin-like hook-associated protein FlgL
MQEEVAQLAEEVTRIATSSKFNGNNMLEADATGAMTISLGAGAGDADQVIKVDTHDIRATGLGTDSNKETLSSSYWISGAANDYIINGGLADQDLEVYVGGVAVATITLGDGDGISLNDLVDEINAQAHATVTASVVTSGETGLSTLKLTAVADGNVVGDIDLGTDATEGDYGDMTWGNAVGIVAEDLNLVDGDSTGTTLSEADISTNAATAIEVLEAAIAEKDNYRAHLGYMMNRLEAAASVIDIQAENLAAAESRISDVDVATEMAAMTRSQVLAQAGVSMLAQANSMPQMALQLLRG